MGFRVRVDKKCYRCYVEIDASNKLNAEIEAIQMALDNKLLFEKIPEYEQYSACAVRPLHLYPKKDNDL